ncbi:hypothetical protein E4U43_006471 [Claviceps pusilla]|uniref:At2g23090-like zinc-binding domain-containing protein n=1 Tax=Claviceps pusilla TaxID=123648 RepID=A0A9P7NE52_9HYPO|nr:hypothetical protein E4U43_006471 [Claviceps pusilla]
MGNAVADTLAQGAKAQQKRERNAKDSKVAKSQLKVMSSSLLEHAENKHGKGIADCFPGKSL